MLNCQRVIHIPLEMAIEIVDLPIQKWCFSIVFSMFTRPGKTTVVGNPAFWSQVCFRSARYFLSSCGFLLSHLGETWNTNGQKISTFFWYDHLSSCILNLHSMPMSYPWFAHMHITILVHVITTWSIFATLMVILPRMKLPIHHRIGLRENVTSIISKGFLRSGLSVPYFSIASL